MPLSSLVKLFQGPTWSLMSRMCLAQCSSWQWDWWKQKLYYHPTLHHNVCWWLSSAGDFSERFMSNQRGVFICAGLSHCWHCKFTKLKEINLCSEEKHWKKKVLEGRKFIKSGDAAIINRILGEPMYISFSDYPHLDCFSFYDVRQTFAECHKSSEYYYWGNLCDLEHCKV